MQWKWAIFLFFIFRSCDIVTKIEGKKINYIPIILTLGKSVYFNLK